MATPLLSKRTAGTRLTLIAALCLACVWALSASVAGANSGHHHPTGAVYTQNNDTANNKVIVWDRFRDGTLAKRQAVSTGGQGSFQDVGCGMPGPPADCPILDSQNAVVSDDGLVFAVNTGSNTVSSFRETHSGLQLVDQKPSGGNMPESLALHDHLLYVLNVSTPNTNGTTGNIYGFRVSNNGQLTPNGSNRPLANAAPPDRSADPRAIGFKPNGKVIVVTEIAAGFAGPPTGPPPGRIDTFVVGPNGQAGPAVSHQSSDALPFGFAFDRHSHLVVSNIHSLALHAIGSVSSYEVSDSGNVTPINTVSSGGALPCWVAISKDNKVAYVVNTGAGNDPARTTRFRISHNGTLTPEGGPAEHTGDFAQTDIDMSRSSRYVYVLAPGVGVPGQTSHIDMWRRHHDGHLTYIGRTPADADMGIGTTGLSAN